MIHAEIERYKESGSELDRSKGSALQDVEDRLAAAEAQADLYEKRWGVSEECGPKCMHRQCGAVSCSKMACAKVSCLQLALSANLRDVCVRPTAMTLPHAQCLSCVSNFSSDKM